MDYNEKLDEILRALKQSSKTGYMILNKKEAEVRAHLNTLKTDKQKSSFLVLLCAMFDQKTRKQLIEALKDGNER